MKKKKKRKGRGKIGRKSMNGKTEKEGMDGGRRKARKKGRGEREEGMMEGNDGGRSNV